MYMLCTSLNGMQLLIEKLAVQGPAQCYHPCSPKRHTPWLQALERTLASLKQHKQALTHGQKSAQQVKSLVKALDEASGLLQGRRFKAQLIEIFNDLPLVPLSAAVS